MSHPILEKHLKKGEPKPVYLFFGEEDFLVHRALARLEGWLRQQDDLAAKVSGDANDIPLADFLSAARSPQLWGGRQLLVLQGVERYKAAELKPLSAYVQEPSPQTCLVLTASTLKMKDVQASALWRPLLETEAALAFPRLREREVLTWLEQEAKQQGKRLEPGVARLLVAVAGSNLADLAQELEKLILYCGTGADLTLVAAKQVATQSRSHSIFELVEALGESRPEKALRVLQRLLALGEPPSLILVMLARQLRLLLRTQDKLAQGLPPAQLAKELGVLPFVAEKLQRQAAQFAPQDLQDQLLRLQEADLQLKTGMSAPQLLLEEVILTLCPLPELRRSGSGH